MLSVILILVAIILDEISGLSDAAFCGFLDVQSLEYTHCSDTEPCSKAALAGTLWITFNALGILMCFIFPAMIVAKKSLSWIPLLFAVIFYTLATIMWFVDNPLCWMDGGAIGTSVFLTVSGIFLSFIACVLAAYPSCCEK